MVKVYVKDLGIEGLKPPTETCSDENCAWHGDIRVRGRIFKGVVVKSRHHHVSVEFYRYVYIPKYERYEVRKTKIKAHNPPCINAKEGDIVIIGETRPISKTIHFVVLQKLGRREEAVIEE
jgi:small subunit ribosomal protein S17